MYFNAVQDQVPPATVLVLGAPKPDILEAVMGAATPALIVVDPDPARITQLRQWRPDGITVLSGLPVATSGPTDVTWYNQPGLRARAPATPALHALFPGLRAQKTQSVPGLTGADILTQIAEQGGALAGPLHLYVDAPGDEADVLADLGEAGILAQVARLDLRCAEVAMFEGGLDASGLLHALQAQGFALAGVDLEDPDWPLLTLVPVPRMAALHQDLEEARRALTIERQTRGRAETRLKKAKDTHKAALSDLKAAAKTAKAERAEAAALLADVKARLETAEAALAQSETAVSEAETARAAAEANVAHTKAELAESQTQLAAQTKTAAAAAAEAQAIATKLDAQTAQNQDLTETLAAVRADLAEAQASVTRAEAAQVRAAAELQDSAARNQDLAAELQGSEATRAVQATRLHGFEEAAEAAAEALRVQTAQNQDLTKTLAVLRAELAEVQAAAAQAEDARAQAEAALQDSAATCADQAARLAEARELAQKLRTRTARNQYLTETLKATRADLVKVQAQAKSDRAADKARLQELRIELSQSRAESTAQTAARKEAETARSAQKVELATARSDLALALRQVTLLQSDLRDLRARFQTAEETRQAQADLLHQLTPRLQQAATHLQTLRYVPADEDGPADPDEIAQDVQGDLSGDTAATKARAKPAKKSNRK